jgi:hypothetical protein
MATESDVKALEGGNIATVLADPDTFVSKSSRG